MEIREIKDKQIWENFLLKCSEKTFLNSWNWGDFQKAMGNKIWRLGVYDNEQLIGLAPIIKIIAKRGIFLFAPHSPAIASAKAGAPEIKKKILATLLEELKELAKQEKISFIRVAPIWERTQENRGIFQKLDFQKAPIHMHPELTWQLDIRPSEEQLLMKMRKTTRYLIRQGLKNEEIEIIKSKNFNDVEIFNKLYQKTVKRHHFAPFSLHYLQNEFKTFSADNQILIFLGKYREEIICSAMIIFWQNIGFYHQGASVSSKIPVSYLMQWEAIREAKERGCKIYNFWGIAEQGLKNKRHPWWGLTLFKKGFGGQRKEYVKTQDFIISQKYWFNFIIETIRRKKRGL